MDLERHINRLRERLAVAAEPGGEETRAAAERLSAALDSAVRLMLLDVLAGAAAEITGELAPGSVELRLREGQPEFVVAPGPVDIPGSAGDRAGNSPDPAEPWSLASSPPPAVGTGDGNVSRINLRLPDQLKTRVEQAADREGLSINAWLVRAVAAAVERGTTSIRREQSTPRGGQRFTGWGR